MEIHFHKNFEKAFQKLSHRIQDKVERTIQDFIANPHNPQLNNHALHGKYQGCRAISVGGDLRLVFIVSGNYNHVEFLMVGKHTQVYK
jgi:addiction module RelE/StbE family toxin